jgi:hypothetical protein
MKKRTMNHGKGYTRRQYFRDDLEDYLFQRGKFRAEVDRASMTNFRTSGQHQATVLLRNVREYRTGVILADHMWIKLADIANRQVMESLLQLKVGNLKTVSFTAVSATYSEPFGGRSFHSWHGYKYTFKEMEIIGTSPSVIRKIYEQEQVA